MSQFVPKTLAELEIVDLSSDYAELEVLGVSLDSRKVSKGDLFAALDGEHHKGIDFVESAASLGAVAALIDAKYAERVKEASFSIPVFAVGKLHYRLGHIASNLFSHPSKELSVIGVTGTNGKTSCAHFISTALESLGVRSAVIGTIGNGLVGDLKTATHTTPDAVSLQSLLADFVQQGARAVVMEVSSHALEQGRVEGVEFDVVAYTNLSRDHLDYHGTMERYAAAKARLFTELPSKHRILNIEDTWIEQLESVLQPAGLTYSTFGLKKGSFHLQGFKLKDDGIEMDLVADKLGQVALKTPILGHFNLYNLLLSFAVINKLGFSVADTAKAISQVNPVPGRMESLSEKGVTAVIDYAHTPDALEKALIACREHVSRQLWVVFGCGGDRDTGKRSEMAAIAEKYSDKSIATSDNPRTEDPEVILDMVMKGFSQPDKATRITDRSEAIKHALKKAQSGDLVLIAGKGHEDYQEVNGFRHHFSDREQVMNFFAESNESHIPSSGQELTS